MIASQTSTKDPFNRLPRVFGQLLTNERRQRKITEDDLALAVGLSGSAAVVEIESGAAEPTLTQFFRIASVVGKAPTLLLIDVINSWRSEPSEIFRRSRPHDFAHLYRLGYLQRPGDFRELGAAYNSVAEASRMAERINVERRARRHPLIDTISVYVRLDSLWLESAEIQMAREGA